MHQNRNRHASNRLCLEPLESRTVPSFLPSVAYNTGATPTAVVTADFNNDQQLDFAITNGGDGNVSVALGNGDGTFQPALNHPIAGNSFQTSITSGDFDEDGVSDLAVGHFQSSNNAGWVGVLLGNGDGTFAGPVNYTAGLGTHSVASGDMDGDGTLDLVTSNLFGASISVLIGAGDGTFAVATHHATGGTSPYGLTLGDFNQDNVLDVAVANNASQNIGVLLNLGNATFAAPRLFQTGGNSPIAVAAGDFTGEGRLDLAVANRDTSSNIVSILICTRPGGFRFKGSLATGVATQDVTVADFDRDGNLDVASANQFSETVTIWRGNGDATFFGREDYSVGRLTFSIAAGDFNGDDHADIVTADLYGIGASILMNAADWSPAPIIGPPSASGRSKSVEGVMASRPPREVAPTESTKRPAMPKGVPVVLHSFDIVFDEVDGITFIVC